MPLPVKPVMLSALMLLVGCSTVEVSRALVKKCEPFEALEGVVAGDLYSLQAPLPCMKEYESVQGRAGQRSDVAVAVAISGGGYRAANFATGALLELEAAQTSEGRNLLSEVDYFSTVSGGGLAAATYITALYRHNQARVKQPFSFARALAGHTVSRLSANLEFYIASAIVRWGLGRNQALHNKLQNLVLKEEGRRESELTLGSVFVPRCKQSGTGCVPVVPQVPYWIANATLARNGAIFPFTPDILDTYGVVGYRHTKNVDSRGYQMPLSVGMTASATFPAGIPPLTLCVDQSCSRTAKETTELQLLDGGAADNLGVMTALAALAQDEAPAKILIVIDAYTGQAQPWQTVRSRLSTPLELIRSATIGLDTAHSRHRYVVAAMANGLKRRNERWSVILLSFEDVRASNTQLHARVDKIGTNFRITQEQQQLLWQAGSVAVTRKKDQLGTAFGIQGLQPE